MGQYWEFDWIALPQAVQKLDTTEDGAILWLIELHESQFAAAPQNHTESRRKSLYGSQSRGANGVNELM